MFPRWNIGSKLRRVKQTAQHLRGSSAGKSFMNSLDDAQAVLDAYHGGKGTVLKTVAGENRVIFRYNGVSGTYVNELHGVAGEASNVFMIKGQGTATVVPVNPLRW